MGAKHLTNSEKRNIRELSSQGLSTKEIAAQTGRSCPTISRVLRKSRPKRSKVVVIPLVDWKAKYLEAVAKLAEHGLI